MALEARIDRLGAELRRPVVLYDHAMNLLAFSAHSEQDIDANRSGAILARRTAPRALELVRSAGAHRAHAPVVIPSDAGLADRIGMPVRHEGIVLGYIVCTAEEGDLPVSDLFEAILLEAARDLDLLLHVRVLEQRLSQRATVTAVRGLLDADAETRQRAAAALLEDGLPNTTRGYLAATFSAQPPGTWSGSAQVKVTLESLLAGATGPAASASVGAVVDDAAVVLLPVVADQERVLGRLRHLLPADVRLGVGSPRTGLVEIIDSAREARLALSATWRDPERYGVLATWSDLAADQLLLRLPLDSLGPADLPDPVRRLLAAPGGPDLARTVERYLEYGADAQATARSLSIHRSTLYYRLDRVTTLTGVDVREGGTRQAFHLGLRVATLCGLCPGG